MAMSHEARVSRLEAQRPNGHRGSSILIYPAHLSGDDLNAWIEAHRPRDPDAAVVCLPAKDAPM